jgi:hypothetical protein
MTDLVTIDQRHKALLESDEHRVFIEVMIAPEVYKEHEVWTWEVTTDRNKADVPILRIHSQRSEENYAQCVEYLLDRIIGWCIKIYNPPEG